MAQYVGPHAASSTVQQLGGLIGKDRFVTLKGNITRHVGKDLYEFSDGTGSVYLDIDRKHWRWPADTSIDHTTPVEIRGKYISQAFGPDKVKVSDVRLVK